MIQQLLHSVMAFVFVVIFFSLSCLVLNSISQLKNYSEFSDDVNKKKTTIKKLCERLIFAGLVEGWREREKGRSRWAFLICELFGSRYDEMRALLLVSVISVPLVAIYFFSRALFNLFFVLFFTRSQFSIDLSLPKGGWLFAVFLHV